ncbi:MAG: pyridoxal phosphate-dependent aminotransferase [Verrucomicrobia bacterium]|nr:pyridoxal phosphate-dependent aminotransferase [Verrucomicrobiota bacterium]
MFATRTDWKMKADRLTRAADQRRSQGEATVDFTQTNPTACGFRYLETTLLTPLLDPACLSYDPHPQGLLTARRAIAGSYAERGFTVMPERLLLTAGTSEGYSHLFRLLLNPGDHVLVPCPSYPLLDLLASVADVTLDTYPLGYDNQWWLDLDGLRAACHERTRAIVVISPNNPTGSYLKASEREALVALARERQLAIIVDEVFADYALDADANRVVSMVDENRVPTFCLNGFSKMLGLPQMKLSWLTINGDDAFVEEAGRRLAIMADTFLSVGTPTQLAAGPWLQQRHAIQAEILNRIRINRAHLQVLRHCRLRRVEGGWSAIVQFPRVSDDDEAVALTLLNDYGVLVDPGDYYGLGGAGCIVVSLLVMEDDCRVGVRALDALAAAMID